jgi:hypothetical protein
MLSKLNLGIIFTFWVLLLETNSAQFIITGNIYNNITNAPISYASVSLNYIDSSTFRSIVSNEEGRFEISEVPKGEYCFQISCMGYHKFDTLISTRNISLRIVDLGSLHIAPEIKSIEEIKITEKQFRGKTNLDRTIYTITNDILESSINGLDVVSALPSIDVDMFNNISIKGSNKIKIYIDGKERSNVDVSQLQPSQIKRIEIINNPSVQYGADITSVLNIVLSHSDDFGLKSNILADVPLSKHMVLSHTGNIEFGQEKYRTYLGLYNFFTQTFQINTLDRISNENTLNKHGKSKELYNNFRVNTGIDYFPDSNNSFNIHFSSNYLIDRIDGKDEYSIIQNGSSLSEYTKDNMFDYDSRNNQLSLFYKRSFDDPKKELTTEIRLLDGKANDDFVSGESMDNTYTTIIENNDINKRAVNFNLNFSNSISNKYPFETGISFSKKQILNDVFYHNIDSSRKIKYYETIGAFYSSISVNINKIVLQPGIRFEYLNRDFSNSNSEIFYLLPKVDLYREFGKNSFSITYSRYINRPSIYELYPFSNSIDTLNIIHGNIYLKPELIDKFSIDYSFETKGYYLSQEIYYKYYSDLIEYVSEKIGDNSTETFPINAGEGYDIGLITSASLKPFKWLAINPYVKLYIFHIDSYHYNNSFSISKVDNISYSGRLKFTFLLPKDFSIRTYLTITGPTKTIQKESETFMYYMVSLNKKILKNGKISFICHMPFTSKYYVTRDKIETDAFTQNTKEYIKSLYLFCFRASYRIGTGAKIKKNKRSVVLDEETKPNIGF